MSKLCEQCGTPVKEARRRYCSNRCSLQGTARQRAESHRKPKSPCPQCGKPIRTRGAIHCGRACANVTRRQEAEARRGEPTPCLRCGTTERRPRCVGQPYCSWECFNEDRYERTGTFARWLAAWQAGEISGTRENGSPDWRVRQGLVLLRGQRCEKCGWAEVNPVSGRVPLHVDHIDGDRTKNRPEDLRLLCPNCHALTPNYQHLNNPRVQPVRQKQSRRYQEVWLGGRTAAASPSPSSAGSPYAASTTARRC
ncbi:HNH endonuclease signature motif containing protein [Streptomyces sp. NPDC006332]|uniref:HNH endonuclease signature motif containing protein n=1 Tax=Streptomyces sp. NPDC006332 TaxID=3155456 RepID=UPI0033AC5783